MNTRTILVSCAAIVIGTVVPTLAQQQVSSQFDKTYDFSKIKTFTAQIASSWGNPIGEKNVLEKIQQALIAKGWAKADQGKADAAVMIHGATETRRQLNAMYGGGGWRFGGMGTITESTYTVGTLILDIFDAGSKELLFRGTAEDQLATSADKNEKKLDKALEKMFRDFPPQAAKKK